MGSKLKDSRLERMCQFYQDFTKDDAGKKELFTKVFGKLSPTTLLIYLAPSNQHFICGRFTKAGEEENWPIMESFLKRIKDNRTKSNLNLNTSELIEQ